MKKAVFFLLVSLLTTHYTLAQQYGWTDISANLPDYANYNDVYSIGEEVWITGWNEGVGYSPDGGATFQIQTLPENSGISSSVFMKNRQEGYVVTFLGNILKTDDGGTNWTTLHEPGGALNSVHFPPYSNTGYTCGTNGTVWQFDDVSISDISPSGVITNLQSICFPEDSNDGKVCGQTTIARYINNTWSNLQFYDATLNYNSIFFFDNNLGWSCGINGTIIRTINGSHWEIMESNITVENFNDIFFINSLEGWAVGTDILSHSVDSGSTWTEELASQTIGVELRAIYFTSAHNGYVVGNGVLLKYGEVSGIGDGVESLPFEIYPNPAKDKCKIQSVGFKAENATLEIFDLNGRKLLKEQIPTGSETLEIDVSSLQNGLYLCQVITESYLATKKIIIQQ